jgi:hypothetical protein
MQGGTQSRRQPGRSHNTWHKGSWHQKTGAAHYNTSHAALASGLPGEGQLLNPCLPAGTCASPAGRCWGTIFTGRGGGFCFMWWQQLQQQPQASAGRWAQQQK